MVHYNATNLFPSFRTPVRFIDDADTRTVHSGYRCMRNSLITCLNLDDDT